MASSYSTDLKLELMVTGENAGTWGDKTNTNLNLVQQAIAGVESIALTDGGTVTLVMSDAAISNARNMVLKLTGALTSASELHIPDSIEKFYIIDATSITGPTNLTVETVSGTGFTLDQAKIYACYSDGTNVTEVSLDTLGGTIGTAGIADAAVTAAKISDNTITAAKISDGTITATQISDATITTAKISDNQITTAKISDNQITTAKISDNQVTAAKLDDVLTDSGGTAGSYTTANITVDAQGRITAASSGSGGAAGFILRRAMKGPSSGTHTFQPTTTTVMAFGTGSGGNGGPPQPAEGPSNPSSGGDGGFGIVTGPVPAPGTAPFTVGGSGPTRNPTTLGDFFTATAGSNGPPAAASPGSDGTFTANPTATTIVSDDTVIQRDAFYGGRRSDGQGPGPNFRAAIFGKGGAGGNQLAPHPPRPGGQGHIDIWESEG